MYRRNGATMLVAPPPIMVLFPAVVPFPVPVPPLLVPLLPGSVPPPPLVLFAVVVCNAIAQFPDTVTLLRCTVTSLLSAQSTPEATTRIVLGTPATASRFTVVDDDPKFNIPTNAGSLVVGTLVTTKTLLESAVVLKEPEVTAAVCFKATTSL